MRVHAECITDDIFGNSSGGKQLAIAMRLIEETGRGVFVYLRGPESKGIDLSHKPRTYNNNSDQATSLGEGVSVPVASREYGIGAQVITKTLNLLSFNCFLFKKAKTDQRLVMQILRDLGVREMKVMTNNPAHYVGLKGYGLSISGKVPLISPT